MSDSAVFDDATFSYGVPKLDNNMFDCKPESISPVDTVYGSFDQSSLFSSSPESSTFSHFSSDSSFQEWNANCMSPDLSVCAPFTSNLFSKSMQTADLFPPETSSSSPLEPSDVESPPFLTPNNNARQFRKTGPGRPSKAQLAARASPENRRTIITKSRQLHNDSASRSRARFSAVLEDLWSEIPHAERSRTDELEVFGQRQLSRSEKVELAILYVRKLQQQL